MTTKEIIKKQFEEFDEKFGQLPIKITDTRSDGTYANKQEVKSHLKSTLLAVIEGEIAHLKGMKKETSEKKILKRLREKYGDTITDVEEESVFDERRGNVRYNQSIHDHITNLQDLAEFIKKEI